MKNLFILFMFLASINFFGQTGKDYLLQGNAKFKAKDYEGAIKDFTKTIEINPKNGQAYINRAECEFLLNQKKEACDDWAKAVELGKLEAKARIKKNCKN